MQVIIGIDPRKTDGARRLVVLLRRWAAAAGFVMTPRSTALLDAVEDGAAMDSGEPPTTDELRTAIVQLARRVGAAS